MDIARTNVLSWGGGRRTSSGDSDPATVSAEISRRRKRLVTIGAIVVAAVLIIAFFWPIPPSNPRLTAQITPGSVSVDAGSTFELKVVVKLGRHIVDPASCHFRWSVTPYTLIDQPFDPTTFSRNSNNVESLKQRLVAGIDDESLNQTFVAGKNGGYGTIMCNVSRAEKHASAEASVTVNSPYFSHVSFVPNVTELLVNRSISTRAVAWDSLDRSIPTATITWQAASKIGLSLEPNPLVQNGVNLTLNVPGEYQIGVTAQVGNVTKEASMIVSAVEPPNRTLDLGWYDMFNVSHGSWIAMRNEAYHNELMLTEAYPYLIHYAEDDNSHSIGSGMRLNITGRNLTDINLNYDPVFIPRLGEDAGGHATIDWYMQYLTNEQLIGQYNPSIAGMDDGWMVNLRGTMELDPMAATAVLGVTESELADFESWWDDNRWSVMEDYNQWLFGEEEDLQVEKMFGSYLQLFTFTVDAEKSGSNVVLTIDTLTWGMECIMAGWLRDSILHTEWWYEDMTFHAEIWPNWADISIDTAVTPAVFSSISIATGDPCWIWQGMLQNNYWQLFDEWYESPDRLVDRPLPPYRYTPGAFNLTSGETLSFTWPDGLQLFSVCNRSNISDITNSTGWMTVGHVQPNATDMPAGCMIMDTVQRKVVFIGPFDFLTWSREQTSNTYLEEQWGLLGALPYGMPYIEFTIEA